MHKEAATDVCSFHAAIINRYCDNEGGDDMAGAAADDQGREMLDYIAWMKEISAETEEGGRRGPRRPAERMQRKSLISPEADIISGGSLPRNPPNLTTRRGWRECL